VTRTFLTKRALFLSHIRSLLSCVVTPAYADSRLLIFRDSLLLPSMPAWILKIEPIGYSETSVNNNKLRCVTTQKSEALIYTAAEAWDLALVELFLDIWSSQKATVRLLVFALQNRPV